MHYIYALIDPTTNEIRYIGKTNNMTKRYRQHLNPISLRSIWIHELKIKFKKPKVKILEKIKSGDIASVRERHWIDFYIKEKAALLNGKYLHPRKKYDVIYKDDAISDDLKRQYELAKSKLAIKLMDDILTDLYRLGWIPAIRTPQKTVWAKIK